MHFRYTAIRSITFPAILVAVVLCSADCATQDATAQTGLGPAIPAHKKLVAFACNTVEPAYLREHIGEIEQALPLDGLVIFVYPDDWGPRRTGQEDIFFGGRRFTRKDFSQARNDLKAVPFKKFTDNFIQFALSARGSAAAENDIGPDLMTNGQFDTNLDGWASITPGLEDWDDADGYPNQGCLILNSLDGSDNGGTNSTPGAGATIPEADGATQYKVSWSIKHVGGGTGLQHVRVVDNNGGCEPNPDPAGEDPCLPFSFNTHGVPGPKWAEQSVNFTPNEGATEINFITYGGGGAAGRNRLDNFRVRKIITPPVEHGNLDWFDPNWSGIAENGAVLAQLARETGLKGFWLDVEHYAGTLGQWKKIFNYSARPDNDKYSLAEVEAQIQRRGREWMQAVAAAYPDITIVVIQNTGWGHHNMVESFVKGMMESRGNATIVDGGEGGYSKIAGQEFAAMRSGAESVHQADPLLQPIQYGFGIWVDHFPKNHGGWHTDPADFHKNYRSPAEFEQTLYGALTAADRYVWLFVWHSDVWFNPIVRPRPMNHQCVLCPHAKVPEAYIEALRNCRQPHDPDWSPPLQAGRFVWFDDTVLVEGSTIDGSARILLENPGLEQWRHGPEPTPDAWIVGGEGPQILRDESVVKAGKYSLRMTTELSHGHVIIDQHIPAAAWAGKTITFGAWTRSDMKGVGGVEILDFIGNLHEVSSIHIGHPGDGEWHFVSATKTIRAEATEHVRLRLSAHIPFIKAAE